MAIGNFVRRMRRRPQVRPLSAEQIEAVKLDNAEAVAITRKALENFDPQNPPQGISGRRRDRLLREQLGD